MAAARDIMRGTFRLSVAVAFLAAAYGFYQQWAAFSKSMDDNLKMRITLECGARLSEENLKTAINEFGLIDLGKVGCADKPFRASFEELRKARDGAMRREWEAMQFDLKDAGQYALGYALLALIVVNLLGLAFVAARALFGWIAAGYKPRT